MNISHQTNGLSEIEPHRFSVFASDVGLCPGKWPRSIATSLGNGQMFIVQRSEVRHGDPLWVDYWQGNGCVRLRIFND